MSEIITPATKVLISAPIVEIKNIIQKLNIDELTMKIVKENCDKKGYSFPNTDIIDLLRKEWINDVVTLDKKSESFKKIIANPSESFQIWVSHKINNPYQVSQRIIDKYSKKYGFEFISLFERIRWKQELAWAKRFRNHSDDDYCVFSGLFLSSCKKNVNKVFSECIELAYSLSLSGKYFSDLHELNISEIEVYDLKTITWDPIFLRYSRKTYSHILNKMPQSKKSVIAQRARDEVFKEEKTHCNTVSKYDYNLSTRLLVVMKSISMNLNSNQVCHYERKFMNLLKSNEITSYLNRSLEQNFLTWLKNESRNDLVKVSQKETEERNQVISTLNSHWMNSLSDDIKELGGDNRRTFSQWRDLILSEQRDAPENPVSDYLFFLITEQ